MPTLVIWEGCINVERYSCIVCRVDYRHINIQSVLVPVAGHHGILGSLSRNLDQKSIIACLKSHILDRMKWRLYSICNVFIAIVRGRLFFRNWDISNPDAYKFTVVSFYLGPNFQTAPKSKYSKNQIGFGFQRLKKISVSFTFLYFFLIRPGDIELRFCEE